MEAGGEQDRTRREERGGGDWSNEWAGSTERPDDPELTFRQGWIAPTSEPPDDVRFRQEHKFVYGAEFDASTNAELVADGLNRYAVPLGERGDDNLPGESLERGDPRDFGEVAVPPDDHAGHRPEWAAATPVPNLAPHRWPRETMRRLGGRPADPLYVFGPDDRQVWVGTGWPWGLVGRIFTSAGWTGTGALIGPRLVATAGHVVPWGQSGWWMKFVPAFFNGQSAHGAGFESYVSDARGWDTGGSVTGYDCAVLRLYEPLGSQLGYFGYNSFSSSWVGDRRWTILGYPGAIQGGQAASYQTGVSVFDIDSDSNGGRELETRADLTPGNSGGPMFGWFNGDPRLVGVVSGEETDWTPGPWPWDWGDTTRGNVIAGGGAFTGLMAWGRANWPL